MNSTSESSRRSSCSSSDQNETVNYNRKKRTASASKDKDDLIARVEELLRKTSTKDTKPNSSKRKSPGDTHNEEPSSRSKKKWTKMSKRERKEKLKSDLMKLVELTKLKASQRGGKDASFVEKEDHGGQVEVQGGLEHLQVHVRGPSNRKIITNSKQVSVDTRCRREPCDPSRSASPCLPPGSRAEPKAGSSKTESSDSDEDHSHRPKLPVIKREASKMDQRMFRPDVWLCGQRNFRPTEEQPSQGHLQFFQDRRVEERRTEDRRPEEKRVEDRRMDHRRHEDRRSDPRWPEDKRSDDNRNEFVDIQGPLGYGELYRYFLRQLAIEFENHTAEHMASMMIECWKSNNYLYSDLEEMYIVNMQDNQDRDLLARELGKTIGDNRVQFPKGLSHDRLVELTIDFFNTEPLVQDRLRHLQELQLRRLLDQEENKSSSPDDSRKRSIYDGLRPVSCCLARVLIKSGLHRIRAIYVSDGIVERLVNAGFTCDRTLQYHAKGKTKFIQKLIPHVFMSKEYFPHGMDSENLLNRTFDYIEKWKNKLLDMLIDGGLSDEECHNDSSDMISHRVNDSDMIPHRGFVEARDIEDFGLEDPRLHRPLSGTYLTLSKNAAATVRESPRYHSPPPGFVNDRHESPPLPILHHAGGSTSSRGAWGRRPDDKGHWNDRQYKRYWSHESVDVDNSDVELAAGKSDYRGDNLASAPRLSSNKDSGAGYKSDAHSPGRTKSGRRIPTRQDSTSLSDRSSTAKDKGKRELADTKRGKTSEVKESTHVSDNGKTTYYHYVDKRKAPRGGESGNSSHDNKTEQAASSRSGTAPSHGAEKSVGEAAKSSKQDADPKNASRRPKTVLKKRSFESEVEFNGDSHPEDQSKKIKEVDDNQSVESGSEKSEAGSTIFERFSLLSNRSNVKKGSILSKVAEIFQSCNDDLKANIEKANSSEDLDAGKSSDGDERQENVKAKASNADNKTANEQKGFEKDGSIINCNDTSKKADLSLDSRQSLLDNQEESSQNAAQINACRGETGGKSRGKMDLENTIEDGEIHGLDNDDAEAENVNDAIHLVKKECANVEGNGNEETPMVMDTDKCDIDLEFKKRGRISGRTADKEAGNSRSNSREKYQTRARTRSRSVSDRVRIRHVKSRSSTRSRSRDRRCSRSTSSSRRRSRSPRTRSGSYYRRPAPGRRKNRSASSSSRCSSPDRRRRGRERRNWRRRRSGSSRSRSNSPCDSRAQWIPVTPCSTLGDIDIGGLSSARVNVMPVIPYDPNCNDGKMVRITKWTGRNTLPGIRIQTQYVTLDEASSCEITIHNQINDRELTIKKEDKIACLSVLSSPVNRSFFSNLSTSPELYSTDRHSWFKVATALLHRKGILSRIDIPPGRHMTIIATVGGPVRKHAGRVVLITRISDDIPIEPQIVRINEKEHVGIDLKNKDTRPLRIDKVGQEIANISVWTTTKFDKDFRY